MDKVTAIAAKAQEQFDSIVAFRRFLHENPEIGMQEFKATARIVEELAKLPGIEVKDCKPGVVAILRGSKPGKTLALRGDMDALPSQEKTGLPFASKVANMCHACGHDMHASTLLGCARILHSMADQLNGTVKFFFQPAEETLQGALHLIKNGCMENPKVDAVIGMHTWPYAPAGSIALRSGPMMAAADCVDVTIRGKEGHAARQHLCIDPIFIAAQVISALHGMISREINALDTAVLSFGTINGGQVRNTIPGEVVMKGTVRTLVPEVREKIPGQIERVVANVAAAFGGEGEVVYEYGAPPVINDEGIYELVKQAGIAMLGEDKVRHIALPVTGGEDLAFYLEKAPGIFFRLGSANDDPRSRLNAHSPELVFDETAILVGMKVACKAALDFLK